MPPPHCPSCQGQKIWKDGIRQTSEGSVQRWLCRDCGFRFSETTWNSSESSEASQRIHTKSLYRGSALPFTRQVGVAQTTGMINLVTVENPIQEKSAGATVVTTRQPLTPQEIKGKLVEYTWFMRKEGYRPSTIKGRLETIKTLVNAGMGPQLLNPDAIKTFIAQRTTWEDGYKRNVVYAYTTLLTMHGLTWNPPRYKAPDKLPFIPLESELDQLITTTGKRMSIFLQGLKETGADPGELFAIKWIDINPENRTLAINYPVKGHKARILNVSSDYISRLNTLPKKSEQVFQGKIESIRRNFEDQRRNAARKLNNPRLLEINFTTFRHWKATFEYHKTKDPYHVKRLLGHNSLRSTEIYINIEQAVFKDTNDQFHVKVAETLDEACKLLEVGFEYVTDMNCKKLFRKRK